MTMKREAKFKGKLTHGLKNNIRDLVIYMREIESLKIFTLMGSFC